MGYRKVIFSLFVIGLFFSCGLSPQEIEARKQAKKEAIILDAYQKILQYAMKNKTYDDGYSNVGYVSGLARFTFYESAIKVFCRVAIPLTGTVSESTEIGDLTNLRIEDECGFNDCNGHYDVSIRGRWNNRSAGNGNLVIAVTKSNTLKVYIFGDGDWKYYDHISLPSVQEIIDILNEAKTEIAAIDGEEPVLVSSLSKEEKQEQKNAVFPPGQVFQNHTREDVLVYLYSDEIEKNAEGENVQRIWIEGYAPTFKREDYGGNVNLDADETFAQGATRNYEMELLLKNGRLYDNEDKVVGQLKILRNSYGDLEIFPYELVTDNEIWYEGEYGTAY